MALMTSSVFMRNHIYLSSTKKKNPEFSCLRNNAKINSIGGVLIDSVLVSSVVNRGFKFQSSGTKNYKIGICCFSTKKLNASLMSKSKDPLVRNRDNVSEWIDMSTRELMFQ